MVNSCRQRRTLLEQASCRKLKRLERKGCEDKRCDQSGKGYCEKREEEFGHPGQRRNGYSVRRTSSVLPNSPESQPVVLSVFMGSGRSQSMHCNVRRPLPPGGSAGIK
jgi:hypothetical protein